MNTGGGVRIEDCAPRSFEVVSRFGVGMVIHRCEKVLVLLEGVLEDMSGVDGKDAVKRVDRNRAIGDVRVQPFTEGSRISGEEVGFVIGEVVTPRRGLPLRELEISALFS